MTMQIYSYEIHLGPVELGGDWQLWLLADDYDAESEAYAWLDSKEA